MSIIAALHALEQGDLIAFPTDTLFGLAASLKSLAGIQKLFSYKKRPSSKPMVILASSLEEIEPLIQEFPQEAQKLAHKYWPGALTLVLPIYEDKIPQEVRACLPTTGFRIPHHPLALELLHKSGPLVVTSVNESGTSPCITYEEVKAFLKEEILILQGGKEPSGKASSVVGFDKGILKIYREGEIFSNKMS
jgi:L-threonylcarbamoyladenylate synthase